MECNLIIVIILNKLSSLLLLNVTLQVKNMSDLTKKNI